MKKVLIWVCAYVVTTVLNIIMYYKVTAEIDKFVDGK